MSAESKLNSPCEFVGVAKPKTGPCPCEKTGMGKSRANKKMKRYTNPPKEMRQAEFHAKREGSDSEDGEAFGSGRRRIEVGAPGEFSGWLRERVRWSENGGRDGRSEIGASDFELRYEGPGGGRRLGLAAGVGRRGHSHFVAFALHRFAAGFFLVGQLRCRGHAGEHGDAKQRCDGEESRKSAKKLHGSSIFRAGRFSKYRRRNKTECKCSGRHRGGRQVRSRW